MSVGCLLQGGELRGVRGRIRRRGVVEYKNGLLRTWRDFREKLKRIVESKYFNRGIMFAILVNTLSMGIEYHEQVRGARASERSRYGGLCYIGICSVNVASGPYLVITSRHC